MPRNSSGTMTLPSPGVPFQSGQTISSAQVNATLTDLATEVGSSLDRAGRGGALAPIRGVDGTAAAPSVSFTAEPASGFYRAGATDVRLTVGGADALLLKPGGVNNLTIMTPSVAAVSATAANAALLLQGNRAAADASMDVALSSTATRTAGVLVQVQNGGVAKLNTDYQGLLSLATPAAAIQPAGLVTTITPPAGLGATAFFWKDALGMVHAQGSIFQSPSSITNNTLLFTFPVGYRPTGGVLRFVSMDAQAASANLFGILVNVDGTVTARTIAGGLASITQIDVTMISFLAQA